MPLGQVLRRQTYKILFLHEADVFCSTYKWFFEYAEKRLEKLAAQEKKLRWG
jgi:hypothetical protein